MIVNVTMLLLLYLICMYFVCQTAWRIFIIRTTRARCSCAKQDFDVKSFLFQIFFLLHLHVFAPCVVSLSFVLESNLMAGFFLFITTYE